MISTVGRGATVVALCFSLGLHWLALQSVAWTTMLVTNVCHVPLSEAVAQTFDGAHPCDLCHTVAAGKNSEKKSQVRVTVAKVDLLCTTRSVSHLPPFVRYDYGAMGGTIPERFPAPPVPPPRLLPG